MLLDHYKIEHRTGLFEYEFYSEGPKGRILKVVKYQKMLEWNENVYKLSFVDYDQNTGISDDSAGSNNNDTEKVLTTVAATFLDFTTKFPGVFVYAEGNTAARTRLYQMKISANLEKIKRYVEIYGFIENFWEPFRKNKNYEAFLARVI